MSFNCLPPTKVNGADSPSSRWNCEHKTVVQAPIEFVWDTLIDTSMWSWNPCVRLSAESTRTGVSGKASIAVCRGRWKIKDFIFDSVNRQEFKFSWSVDVCGCKMSNVLRLVPRGSKTTQVTHVQKIIGNSPTLRWVLPLKKMKTYPMCMNEALKNHVESRHFNHLLFSLSTREMSTATESTASLDISESSTSFVNYWKSSPDVRRQVLSTFLGERPSLSEM